MDLRSELSLNSSFSNVVSPFNFIFCMVLTLCDCLWMSCYICSYYKSLILLILN